MANKKASFDLKQHGKPSAKKYRQAQEETVRGVDTHLVL
jgi:hypothetical protein